MAILLNSFLLQRVRIGPFDFAVKFRQSDCRGQFNNAQTRSEAKRITRVAALHRSGQSISW